MEGVLGRVDGRRQQQRQHPRQQPDDDRREQVGRRQDPMCRDREHRPGAEQVGPQQRGDRAGQGDRDEAPRLPLEQEEFDGQEHGGHRRVERRRHPPRRAGHEQRLALRGREMEDLGDDRPERRRRS